LLIACSLVVAVISMLISIKVSAATVWSGVAPPQQTINPARKGDRLPLVLASDPSPADRPMKSTFRAERFSTVCLMVAKRWPAISLALRQRTSQAVACHRRRGFHKSARPFR
jgi:hypothetical protein